jgi:Protein of unknown function (DUF2946)
MNRRSRLGIVFAALMLHALVPFAAYAISAPTAGPSDYCSVYRNAPSKAPLAPLPASRHQSSHCAYCPSGSATAAILPPPPILAPVLVAVDERVLTAQNAVLPLSRVLVPPSRAPPRFSR